MALEKEITNGVGQITNYHKIGRVVQEYTATPPWISIEVLSYASEEYREKEKETHVNMILDTNKYNLPFKDIEDFSLETLYGRLKSEVPDFKGATDLL